MTFIQQDIQQLTKAIDHISDIHYSIDGRSIFYKTSKDGKGEIHKINESGGEEKISRDLDVRGTVGYGGGSFDIRYQKIIVSTKDGGIYSIEVGSDQPIIKITSAFSRTSSPKISFDEKWALFVFDQDEIGGIGLAQLQSNSDPIRLVERADFYLHPQWHPSGEMIAWVEWDHPHMPWDASKIMLAQFDNQHLTLEQKIHVDGGIHESANQPNFSPDGKWLSYIKRNGNWDDLILFNLDTHEKKTIIKGNGFHLRMPDWIQGLHSYQWGHDSNSIFFIKYHRGTSSISRLILNTMEQESIDISPYTWASQLTTSPILCDAIFIGSSKRETNRIVRITNRQIHPVRKEIHIPEVNVPDMQEISFPTSKGKSAYAWYCPPLSSEKRSDSPPCIINIHSGPTSVKHSGFSVDAMFFTSRGFSVVYLNYRGSVTFGYEYQNALRRKWGETEVEDTIQLIKYLHNKGLIDKDNIAVMGSSAGGFSVLNLLIKHPGLFKAAICSYAVSDLVDDARHTHKFERYYHQFLTGDFSTEYDRFVKRSPISHINKIKDPVALFHGSDDVVVAPKQSRKIYESLAKRKIPCILKIYEGEGHGFRRQGNIEDYYMTAIDFLFTHLKK